MFTGAPAEYNRVQPQALSAQTQHGIAPYGHHSVGGRPTTYNSPSSWKLPD